MCRHARDIYTHGQWPLPEVSDRYQATLAYAQKPLERKLALVSEVHVISPAPLTFSEPEVMPARQRKRKTGDPSDGRHQPHEERAGRNSRHEQILSHKLLHLLSRLEVVMLQDALKGLHVEGGTTKV